MNLEEYKNYIKGKKVCVIGLGRSNMPLISLLSRFGADITACDRREDIGEALETLKTLGAEVKPILFSILREYVPTFCSLKS